MNTLSRIFLVSAVAALPLTASAALYTYEDLNANNGSGNNNTNLPDRLETVTTTYNDVTEDFTFDVTFNTDPTDVNGFWLVVNNGVNPKQADVNELAIMYGDMTTGTLSTYVYNGLNNANSINTQALLQTDTFNVTDNSFSIDINATAINDYASWDAPTAGDINGIGFDEEIGVWFHISTGSEFISNDGGDLTGYSFDQQGWYDFTNRDTVVTEVPEPGSIALLALGLVGLRLARKKA